ITGSGSNIYPRPRACYYRIECNAPSDRNRRAGTHTPGGGAGQRYSYIERVRINERFPGAALRQREVEGERSPMAGNRYARRRNIGVAQDGRADINLAYHARLTACRWAFGILCPKRAWRGGIIQTLSGTGDIDAAVSIQRNCAAGLVAGAAKKSGV